MEILLLQEYGLLVHQKNASREEKLKTHYKGTYYIKIDKTSKEVQQSVISEFSKEDIKEIIPSEKVYGIGKKLKYSVFEVIPTNNGGTILVGEKYQRVWRSSDNGTTITTYYADIIVSFINPEGEVQWSKVIPKSQLHSVSLNYITMFFSLKRLLMGSEYFSYIPLIQDDMFYLLYNDHPKNLLLTKLTEKQKGITQNANGTIPVIYRFDLADGSFKKELYREVDAKGLYMKPAFSFYNQQTSETLIFSQKSKEYMFGVFK
jgi:hypothetical protein